MNELEILMDDMRLAQTPEEALAILERTPRPLLFPIAVAAIRSAALAFRIRSIDKATVINKIYRYYLRAKNMPKPLVIDTKTQFYLSLAYIFNDAAFPRCPWPPESNITIYRGIGKHELEQYKKEGPSALGVWWTPSKEMALYYSNHQHQSPEVGYLLCAQIKAGQIMQYHPAIADGLHDDETLIVPEDIPGFSCEIVPCG